MNDIIVFYHANCTDGLGAAYSAWKKLGQSADYIPMFYKNGFTFSDLPNIKDKHIYVLDFSFSKEIILQIKQEAKSFQLLDHHISAFESLKDIDGCYFDLNKSGATIAWDYFNPNTHMPTFLKYIEDGDLFLHKFKETRPFYRGLTLEPNNFELLKKLENENELNNLLQKGEILHDFFMSQIEKLTHDIIHIEILGFKGVMVNAPGFYASELGSLLAKNNNTYALIWSECSDVIKCSLRSSKDFDCSIIAKHYHGCGHKQAASFGVKNTGELEQIITRISNV